MGGYVQSANNANTSTSSTTLAAAYTSPVTAGNLLVVATGFVTSSGATHSVSDSQGNTWHPVLTQQDMAVGYSMGLWWAVAGSSGADTVTLTISTAVTFIRLGVHEYNGWNTLDTAAFQAVAFGVNPWPAVNVITAVANELMFAWAVDNNGFVDTAYKPPAVARESIAAEWTGDQLAPTAGTNSMLGLTAAGGGGMFVAAFMTPTGVSTSGSGAITFAGTGAATFIISDGGVGSIVFAGTGTATVAGFAAATGTGIVSFAAHGTATWRTPGTPTETAKATVHVNNTAGTVVHVNNQAGLVVHWPDS